MLALDIIFFAGLGLIIGSFLNVAVLRYNTNRSILGRSGCLSCGKELKPFMLVPVLSWVALGGRCSMCGSGISAQYPLVETATGLAFAMIAMAPVGYGEKAFLCVIASILIAITAYDMKHTIIPDPWAYGFALLSFIYAFVVYTPVGANELALLVLSGPMAALPLGALWVLTSGRGIGLGDAKLALGIGWLLGVTNGLIAVMGAFVIGAVFALAILLPMRWYGVLLARCGLLPLSGAGGFTMKSEVPFGPFLVISTAIVWFLTSLYGSDALSAVFL